MGPSRDELDVRRDPHLSRAEHIARALERDIAAGQLTTTDRLGTREELRERFNVAAATMNQAIRLLGTRGLVEARPGPGGGVFVTSPAARLGPGPFMNGHEWETASIADYHEVREALEPSITRHAARHHRAADIRDLQRIVDQMQATLDDPIHYLRLNTTFHRRVASMSRNAPLRSMYATVLDYFESTVVRSELPARIDQVNVDVHRELAVALDGGDGPALEAAIARHGQHRVLRGMMAPSGDRRRR